DRTRGSARRPHPPAACISVSRDSDGTECNRHSSARRILLESQRFRLVYQGVTVRQTGGTFRIFLTWNGDGSQSDPLDFKRHALPDADAHRRERALAALLDHMVV